MRNRSMGLVLPAALFSGSPASVAPSRGANTPVVSFDRVGTFVVCENTSCDTDVVEATVSEIVTASQDGRTLVYADSALGALGFVDIADAGQPQALGSLLLDEKKSKEWAWRRTAGFTW